MSPLSIASNGFLAGSRHSLSIASNGFLTPVRSSNANGGYRRVWLPDANKEQSVPMGKRAEDTIAEHAVVLPFKEQKDKRKTDLRRQASIPLPPEILSLPDLNYGSGYIDDMLEILALLLLLNET